jgi:hypothetical protein
MTPNEQIAELERRIEALESLLATRGGMIVLTKSVLVDGKINADRIYTQRTGSYVELTT